MSRVLVLTHRRSRLERQGVETGTQRASRSHVPMGGGLGRFCPIRHIIAGSPGLPHWAKRWNGGRTMA